MTKGILFARDKSQMCNNLLQFAHVYAWGREHGRRTISMRFSYKYPYFHIQHTDHTSFIWYLLAKYAAALHILPTVSFKHSDCDRERLIRKMEKHRNIVVAGWHARFYDLFLKYRDEITALFAFEPIIYNKVKDIMDADRQGYARQDTLTLGIHIRRGDYKEWRDGRYYYDDDTFIAYISTFAEEHKDKNIIAYICGNDPKLDIEYFRSKLEGITVRYPQGNPAEDLCLLSECDYLIGPPSTFSLVAAMYHDLPLCWMVRKDVRNLEFHKFEELFRDLDDCGDNVYGLVMRR